MESQYYLTNTCPKQVMLTHNGIDKMMLRYWDHIFPQRPPKCELPAQIAECGTVRFEFGLDYASFRDIQRHRAVTQRMPLLTPLHGFESWYLDEMPISVATAVKSAIDECVLNYRNLVDKEADDVAELQYLIPMGCRVPQSVTGDLAALTYLIELRSTPLVHPTLQNVAHQMGRMLEFTFRDHGFSLNVDYASLWKFDPRRGKHDIVEKKV